MSEAAGLVNVYVCRVCGGKTVTKNRDAGTTPFGISCRATKGCRGDAFSSFYRVDQNLEPTILWITPTPAELNAFLIAHADRGPYVATAIVQHVAQGGLLDVPVTPAKATVHPRGPTGPKGLRAKTCRPGNRR